MHPVPLDPSGILPHRRPFLHLDRLAILEPGRLATGWKQVSASEHTGARPWPRMLLVEVMAQTSAALLFEAPPAAGELGLLAGVPQMTFHRDARVGEAVVATSELVKRWGDLARFKVKVEVEGELAAEGVLLLAKTEGHL